MIYLIKYKHKKQYYCTNDEEELREIKNNKYIPGTSIKLDINNIKEIKDKTTCDSVVGRHYSRNVDVADFQKFIDPETTPSLKIYISNEPFIVNLNMKETIKINNLSTCIGIYIKSNDDKLIGFHYVDEFDNSKLPQAVELMKINNMTTINSNLILYYVPKFHKESLKKQNEIIILLKNFFKFQTTEIIEGQNSSVIYGIDIHNFYFAPYVPCASSVPVPCASSVPVPVPVPVPCASSVPVPVPVPVPCASSVPVPVCSVPCASSVPVSCVPCASSASCASSVPVPCVPSTRWVRKIRTQPSVDSNIT